MPPKLPIRTLLRLLAVLTLAVSATAAAQPVPVGTLGGEPVFCIADPPPEGARRAPTFGEVRMLLVRPRFASDTEDPPAVDVPGLEAWYDEASYGLVDLQITAPPVVELSLTRGAASQAGDGYRSGIWVDEMYDQLADAGLYPEDFHIVAVVAQPGIPFDLAGATGRSNSSDRVWATRGSELVLAHEIGHTMGLSHAGRFEVTGDSQIFGSLRPYGNPYDVMGNVSAGQFGADSKRRLYWIPQLDNVVAEAVPSSGNVLGYTGRLRAIDGPGRPNDGPGLRIDLPGTSAGLCLRAELRPGAGGVLLHRWSTTSITRSIDLLDATPTAEASDGAYALTTGQTFVLSEHLSSGGLPEMTLSVQAQGEDADGPWADVYVTLGLNVRNRQVTCDRILGDDDGGSGTEGGGQTGEGEQEELPNRPPAITSAGTAEGPVVAFGETLTLQISATDPEGRPLLVEYDTGTGAGWERVTQPPFELAWTPEAPGAYTIQTRAIDEEDAVAVAAPYAVLVTDPADTPVPVAEIGIVRAARGVWTPVPFGTRFETPVVIARTRRPATSLDVPRVRVADGGVEVWAPGAAGEAEVVLVAVEAGTHRLGDGSTLHARHVDDIGDDWGPAGALPETDEPLLLFGGAASDAGTEAVVARFLRSASGELRARLLGEAPSAPERLSLIAIGKALLPSADARDRLEAGSLRVPTGDTPAALRQSYPGGPGAVVTGVQTTATSTPFVVRLDADGPATLTTPRGQYGATAAYLALGLADDTHRVILHGTVLDRPAPTVPTVAEALRAAVAPNPSAGTATLRLALPDAATPQVSIIDLLGREVARLSPGTLDAGEHTIALPRLSSGSYLVRVQTGAEALALRLTVTR